MALHRHTPAERKRIKKKQAEIAAFKKLKASAKARGSRKMGRSRRPRGYK